jgi:hypothetical protein
VNVHHQNLVMLASTCMWAAGSAAASRNVERFSSRSVDPAAGPRLAVLRVVAGSLGLELARRPDNLCA